MSVLTYSNHRIEDLVLSIINTGETYQDRLHAARLSKRPSQYRYAAWRWIDMTVMAASKFEHRFGIPTKDKFTTEDILEAALHLARYYREHLEEMETPSS